MPMPTGFDPNRLLNDTIGGYELQELLGTGNAPVYRAFDPRKNEYVAFKLLAWPGAPLDETTLRRFKREIDLLRKRRHAAIIDIYDWHTSGDYVYMAMECCDGTLGRWLQGYGHGKPKLAEVLAIAEPLAAALDFLHEGSPPVLHRDIKPANLLFKGPHWYISDFGIARLEADQLATNDGVLLGTLRYAAPEQLLGNKLGPATDIYSFGLVVYEMLAGGWVLDSRGEGAAYAIPPLSRFRKGLGPAVDDLFRRWLAADPRERPIRAADAVRELAAAAGVLRDPALARLYDLAADLAARPRDPAAWDQAHDLLAALALHEPAFRDPRGLAVELQRRQAGESPGPQPPGFSGAHPADFYSDRTVSDLSARLPPLQDDAEGDSDGEADADRDPVADSRPNAPAGRKGAGRSGNRTTTRLRPPGDLGAAPFAPRSRYEAESLLVVPRDTRLAGAVFGRQVALEAGARVDGDVYSLGDLTLGAGAEIGGAAWAAGSLQMARDVKISGPVVASDLDLGRGARMGGWALAGGTLTAERDVVAAGLLAGGALTLSGPATLGAPAVGSVGATVSTGGPVQIGGLPADSDSVHSWSRPPGQPAGQALTGLLTAAGRALAEGAEQGDAPAALALPRPVSAADAPRFAVAPAGARPTLYLPVALQPDAAQPPAGLPADPAAWEGPVVAAALLDTVWREFARQMRIPAVCAALLTGLCWGATLWLALTDQAVAGAWLLAGWAGVLLVAALMLWALRPRPLELVRLWWAWETWSVDGGVLVWDTLDPGSAPGYATPNAPLEPLAAPAHIAADTDSSDSAVLSALTDLTAGLTDLPWQTWPGVFTPHAPDDGPGVAVSARELLHLPVEVPPDATLPDLPVLLPRYDPVVVRAGADHLAAWPATVATAREVWRLVESRLQAIDPRLDRWEGQAMQATDTMRAAAEGLAAARARAVALADEALGALEREIAPDIDRLWTLHVEGSKLLGAYYEQSRTTQQARAERAAHAAAAHAAAAARELRRQETALAEVAAELAPLAGRWSALAATHEQLGAELRRAWKAARSAAERHIPVEERFVAPRALSLGQASGMVPNLAQEAGRLTTQVDDLAQECAREERDLPSDVPWPLWPTRISQPPAVDAEVAALTALARRVRNEPTRARERLDRLGSLRDRTRFTLERALGARDALTEGLTSEPEGSAGRLVSLRDQTERIVAALHAQLDSLTRLARRLEAATVGYDDVADALASALKGGRNATTWEQGRRLHADYARLSAEQAATQAAATAARAALGAAQDEAAAIQTAAASVQDQSVAAETGLLAHSDAQAQAEEAGLRRHVATLRAGHTALLAEVDGRGAWLTDLAAFADRCSDLKIRAAAQLCDRARMLTALADGRIADTAAGRADALWPDGSWPDGDMRYLLPVWLLRYRPLGRRDPRLLAVTPGHIAAAAQAPRWSLAPGIQITPHPALAARFAADGLTEANRRPGRTQPLPGPNLLAAPAPLLAQWRDLAAAGLVAPWIGRTIQGRREREA